MSADYVSKLAELLTITFTATDSSIRAQAERALREASHDLIGFTQALLHIIQTQPDEVAHGAGAYLCNLLAQAYAEGRVLGESRMTLGLMLGRAVVESSFDSVLKTRLAETLGSLITNDISDPQTNLAYEIQPLVQKALQGDVGSILGGLKILRPMYQALVDSHDFVQSTYLQMLAVIAFKAIQEIHTARKEASEAQLKDSVSILLEVSMCLQSFIEYYDVTSLKNMGLIIQCVPVVELMAQTLLLQLPEPGNPSYNSVVNVSANPILTQLNFAKANMLDSLVHLTNFVLDFPDEGAFTSQETEVFWQAVRPAIDSVLIAVLELSSSAALKDYLTLEFVSEYLTKALDFLSTVTREPRIAETVLPRAKTLVIDAIMILMTANHHELTEFEDTPEGFLSLAQDTCEKQESQTPKTCAAGLLDSLCAHVDGVLSFTMRVCCQFVCHISLADDPNNYVNLADLTESTFYKMPQESQLEACLIILSLLSKYTTKRVDLQAFLDMMLQATRTSLLATVHPLILCRLCTFIYYNAEHLAKDSDDLFDQLVLVVIRSIQFSNTATATAGADCLSYLIKDEAVCHRLQMMLGEIVQVILELVVKTGVKGVFDALEEISLNFVEDLFPYSDSLMTALVQRVLTEQYNLLRQHTKESIFIIKAWNIIRTLVDAPQMVPKLDSFERILLPLISSVSDPQAINYDEDLVLLIHTLISKRMAVSQVCWDVLIYLPGIQAKNRGVFFQMFELLNAYIHYGKIKLIDSPTLTEQLVEMCEVCLFSTYNSRANEAMSSEGAIILQLMLQDLPGAMDSLLERVLAKCLERYSRVIVNEFFKIRLLGVVLSAIVYNPQLTQQILATQQSGDSSWLKFILTEIVANRAHFSHRYDRKLAVLGLCTLISHPVLETDVVRMLAPLFETIIIICSMSTRKPKTTKDMDLDGEASNKKKRKTKAKEQAEAHYKMSLMLTQITSFDELEFFKQMLKKISASASGLKMLVGGLSAELLEDLEMLVKSKTVATNVLGGSAVRKVIKAKHLS